MHVVQMYCISSGYIVYRPSLLPTSNCGHLDAAEQLLPVPVGDLVGGEALARLLAAPAVKCLQWAHKDTFQQLTKFKI